MKKTVSVIAMLGLTECATWGQLDEGLTALVGKPITVAIEKIGYPNTEQTITGRKLYRWGSSSQGVISMPTQTTTTGSVGTGLGYRPYTATTYGSAMAPIDEELLELTGKQGARAQQKALNQMGITFRVRADGKTLVLKETIHQLFSVKHAGRPIREFKMNLENA